MISSGGNRDIVFTEDIGITPGNFTDALTSRVGPFLQHVEDTLIDPATGVAFVPVPGGPAAQPLVLPFDPVTGFIPGVSRYFLGDGVTSRYITGSPFNTNYFEICGPFDGPEPAPTRCYPPEPLHRHRHAARPEHADRQPPQRHPRHLQPHRRRLPGGRDGPRLAQPRPGHRAQAHRRRPVRRRRCSWPARPRSATGTPRASRSRAPTSPPAHRDQQRGRPPTSITTHVTDEITIQSAAYSAGTLTVVATSSDKGDANVHPAIAPAIALACRLPGGHPDRFRHHRPGRGDVHRRCRPDPAGLRPRDLQPTAAWPPPTPRMGVADPAYPAGVPFVGDDAADVIQSDPDRHPDRRARERRRTAGRRLIAGTLTILAPRPTIGAASVSPGPDLLPGPRDHRHRHHSATRSRTRPAPPTSAPST